MANNNNKTDIQKSIDKCIFSRPAKEGQLLKIYGKVLEIKTTSIVLEMEARSHNVYNGKQNIILKTNMTFVRIDEQGDAIPISERAHKKLNQENNKDVKDQLPKPVGYRILVLPFTPKEKTKGGILFSQEQLDKARIATTCGYVLKMGDLAYADKEKFGKPWCKVGDWVMFARYAGARLPIEGGEVRILNDDEVLGTIGDPESILHYI